ncbi:glycosyl hydrolase [Leptospira gomenensis]|uniref:Glycosyl hydrolase n=1 Tax=Leptospira gomenensis TaxID=2484974 RepID=A0A5F1Y5F7_9LEPT|nr:glycosyl hydrolase family 18 protein [Leptospira gomenensis]TGK27942.1 glycosyl hydrolase [Leptospira gomenensis]TGK45452.1 glycosyl hydrolase [Leptospira gomenensis]TGK45839.1 glycosyl hydrolase [Leptospira gomenensis]TGK65235.1 glycosyl hydrolase [Leptospira gomenensis]
MLLIRILTVSLLFVGHVLDAESNSALWYYAIDTSVTKPPDIHIRKTLSRSHTLCFTGNYILSDGTIRSVSLSEDWKHFARSEGIRLLPLITNRSDKHAHFLESEKGIKIAIDNLILLLDRNPSFDGLHFDIETIPKSFLPNYIRFLKNLKSKLPKDKTLTVAVFPQIEFPNPNFRLHSSLLDQDWIDEFVLMSYDLHSPKTVSGPVTSLSWTEKNLRFLSERIPPSKIWLGLPLYGYFWKTNGKVSVLTQDFFRKKADRENFMRNSDGYISFHNESGIGYIADLETLEKYKRLSETFGIKGIAYWRMGF